MQEGELKWEQLPDEKQPSVPAQPIQRVDHGYFRKGVSANPKGRPMGARTKKTRKVKRLLENTIVEMFPRYRKALERLPDKEFCQAYFQLLDYLLPRMQRMESVNYNVEAASQEPETIQIGETVITLNP